MSWHRTRQNGHVVQSKYILIVESVREEDQTLELMIHQVQDSIILMIARITSLHLERKPGLKI